MTSPQNHPRILNLTYLSVGSSHAYRVRSTIMFYSRHHRNKYRIVGQKNRLRNQNIDRNPQSYHFPEKQNSRSRLVVRGFQTFKAESEIFCPISSHASIIARTSRAGWQQLPFRIIYFIRHGSSTGIWCY